jgi:pilus assembly protein CpaE
MRCFVASDDIMTANQVGELLIQLGHDCPVSRLLRLDQIVPAIDASARAAAVPSQAAAGNGAPEIIVVVLSPDPERGLKVVKELRGRIGIGILAVGPATDAKLVLRALREGASEYLDQADLRTELSGVLARLDTAEKAGRMIAVLAPSGASGGSTIAANIAILLAQNHTGCLLLDMNLETGDLAPMLDLKPAYTLTDVCQNAARLDFNLLQGCLTPHTSGLQLLAAPAHITDAVRVTPAAINLVLPLAIRHFPFVVVDLDRPYRAEQQAVMLQADVILLVMRPDFISLRNTRRTLDFLQEFGFSRDRVQIVVNRSGQPGEIAVAQAEESLGMKILHCLPDDPKTVNRAINNGIPVVLQSPTAKISRALVELATSLERAASPVDQKTGPPQAPPKWYAKAFSAASFF